LKSIIDGYSELKEEDKNNLERDVPKYCKDVVGKVSEQAAEYMAMIDLNNDNVQQK
jgi:hypothetical protein